MEVDTSVMSRLELKAAMSEVGLVFLDHQSDENERVRLRTILCKKHPIHGYLANLANSELKRLLAHLGRAPQNAAPRNRQIIAHQFLELHASAPLTALKRAIQSLYASQCGIGFANTGNSCYMNALLNCLLSTEAIKEYLLAAFQASEYITLQHCL